MTPDMTPDMTPAVRPDPSDNYFWQDGLVILRGVEEGDWESGIHNAFDTPARRRLQYEVELPPTEAGARAFDERFRDFTPTDGRIMFTIMNYEGTVVGGVNINSIDEKNGRFSIGMQIDRDHRGKGYGTATLRILFRYAFFERRLNKFDVSILEGNIAAEKGLRKLGCRQEGVRRQEVYTDGRYHDTILFGLTREDFEQNEKEKENTP